MGKRQYLLDFGKALSRQMNLHYTLTPDHLYIHSKKRLHKSKIIYRFGLSDDNELNMRFSEDGGETWLYKIENGNILHHIATRRFAYEADSEEAERILNQPSAGQSFLNDCKRTAQKYKRKILKNERMNP